MKIPWRMITVALLLFLVIAPVFNLPKKADASNATSNGSFYVGVTYGGDSVAEAKSLIDNVSSYTNLFVTDSMDAGLTLSVLPSLGESGYITLQIRAEMTHLIGDVSGSPAKDGQMVENTVIVEIKSVERHDPVFEAQVLTYLKLTGRRLGLLINFNVPVIRDGIKRIAL
jgi:hypothetical protein